MSPRVLLGITLTCLIIVAAANVAYVWRHFQQPPQSQKYVGLHVTDGVVMVCRAYEPEAGAAGAGGSP